MQFMHSRSNKIVKMTFLFIALVMAFMFQSNSLKLHSELEHLGISYSHLALNTSTATSNITDTRQINFTQQIIKINSNFSIAADINERILKVQKQYLGHQQQILILADFNLTSFDSTNYTCKQPSQNIIDALQYRATDMGEYLQQSLLKVNFIQNQQDRANAKIRLQNQILYMQSVSKLLKSKCKTSVKLSRTTYLSNPNAKNWILGDWTYDQFINDYINKINSNSNTTKCPIDSPFVSNGQCINCQIPTEIFNMKDGKCSSCDYGRIVNIKSRKCVSQINYVSNLMDTHHPWITKQGNMQKVIEKFNKQKSMSSSVICPFQTPFVLNEQCSICPQGTVYVAQQKNCQIIPYNMTYDPNIHQLVKKLNNYETNPNVSGEKPTVNLNSCPSEVPYFDSITCVQCYVPFYFSSQQKACIQCPDKNNCPPKKQVIPSVRYVTNSLASNVTGKSTQQVLKYWDKMTYQLNSYQDSKECPIQTPFYQSQTKKCIKCDQQTPLFNISTLNCVACGQNLTFNKQTYLCQSNSSNTSSTGNKKTNLNASNIWTQNYTDFVSKQNKTVGDTCPLTTPYSNGTNCFSCNSTQIFNTTSLKCSNCPQKTVFNTSSHICDSTSGNGTSTGNGTNTGNGTSTGNGTTSTEKKTFTGATNLWVANLTDYNQKQNASTAQQCTKDAPFSNGTNCIACKTTQIFNTSTLNCSTCPNGTVYNSTNFTCSVGKPNIFMPGKLTRLIGTPTYYPANYTNYFANLNQSQYNVQNCSSSQYSTKTGCTTCKDTQYFCVDCLKCMNCTNIDKNGVCLDYVTFLTNTSDLNKLLGSKDGEVTSFVANQTKLISTQPDKYMTCDSSKPYVINKTCSICPTYYNVSSLACTQCPSGQRYNQTSRICYTPPFEAISNLSYGVPPYYTANQTKIIEEYQKAKQAGVQICPFATPFFNGSACIKCQASFQYFNLDSKKCQNCPTGKKYDLMASKCLDNPPKFYTSLSSSNLIYDGQPYNYYKQKVDSYKSAGATQCPSSTPYASDNGCIKCGSDKPYFSLYDLSCKACPTNYTYNAVDHECQDPNGDISNQPQASIQKSLANLFT